MAIVTRNVFGTIKSPSNELLTGKEVSFIPVSHFGSGSTVIPSIKKTVTLNAESGFTIALTTLDDAGVTYTCRLPSGEIFQFVLEAGADISLNELRSQAVINQSSENVTAVIEELVETLMASYAPINHTHTPANIAETIVIKNDNYQLVTADNGKLFIKQSGGASVLTLPTSGLTAGSTKFFFCNLTDSYLTVTSNSVIIGIEITNASITTRIPGSSCEVIYLGAGLGWLCRKTSGEWG